MDNHLWPKIWEIWELDQWNIWEKIKATNEYIKIVIELFQEVDNLWKLKEFWAVICSMYRESWKSKKIKKYLETLWISIYTRKWVSESKSIVLHNTSNNQFYLEGEIGVNMKVVDIFTPRNEVGEYFSWISFWGKNTLLYLESENISLKPLLKSYTINGVEYHQVEGHRWWYDLYIKWKNILHVLGFCAIGFEPKVIYDDDEIDDDDIPEIWEHTSIRLFFDTEGMVYCEFDGREFWPTITVWYDKNLKPIKGAPLH